MCSICEKTAKARFADDIWAQQLAMHMGPAEAGKYYYAFAIDGVGDLKPPVALPAFLITTDNVPDAPDTAGSTNPTLTVTGPGVTTPIVSTIDTVGDQDFYTVTLTAGTAYELGLYSYTGGPNATGVTDPYLELYAADGSTLVVSADGGADTVYNQANSGFDVLLVYTPTVSGTFYVNARAFSNSPVTPTGDSVGDYQLFVREQDLNDPNAYTPYYEPADPLYAIDWGTQVNRVNQSVRNPDGQDGPRDTGNAQSAPTYGSALDMESILTANGKTMADIAGKNVITIYFAKPGDVIYSNDPTQPGLPPATLTVMDVQQFERDAVFNALAQFEKVADVIYLEVQDRALSDFTYTSYQGTPGPGVSLLGSMSPPDESDEGLAQFNAGDYRWNALDLGQGGFSYVTLIHEFGHGHGLAHPHDNGGRSGIMNGVVAEGPVADYTLGDHSLNQAVFTMMSYQDGWPESPYGNAETDVGYGYLGGLMAFDIAAIQDKYGVNEDTATGNDTYTLKDVNAVGTYYTSIWDAGGTDEIVYSGSKNTTIDLRPATLEYEIGGGGNVSFAYGIFGGYTIANGVTIENATSGSGHDTLRGNAANNVLNAGSGNDALYLEDGGTDTAIGGAGNDGFFFGAALSALDDVDGGAGKNDQVALQGNYNQALGAANLKNVETLVVLSSQDARFGGESGSPTTLFSYNLTSVDANVASGGSLTVIANALLAGENFTFNGSAETNGAFNIYGGRGIDTLTGGAANDGFLFGDGMFSAADSVNGGAGNNDQLALRGDYATQQVFAAGTMTNVEALVVLSGADTRFGSAAGPFSYSLKLHDGNVASGKTLSVTATTLTAAETFHFDGSLEQGGKFAIFGGAGNDLITGGNGADQIYGARGADQLAGNGGADKFVYRSVLESGGANQDQILGFAAGDKIDLAGIDAISATTGVNDGFTFIGAGAFTNQAGQLRAYQSGSDWFVEGDVDGNGTADLVIALTDTTHTIVVTDFVL